jgi:O-antigen/teichoic acid export membrane protein
LGQLGAFFITLDRLVLASSPQILGYYTVAIQAGTFAGMIPIAFTTVLYPQMAHKYGETHNAMDVWHIARKGAMVATAVGGFVGVTGWILIPSFVETFLPKYTPGIAAAQWASFMGLSMGFSVFNNIYNVIKRQDIYLFCFAIGVVAYFSMWFLLTLCLNQPKITSAVQSMVIAAFIMSAFSGFISNVICKLQFNIFKSGDSGNSVVL